MAAAVARVLYITYDGLTDPLGRSQVLPYLEGCAARGHEITILSCEKADRLRKNKETVARLCRDSGIGWRPLSYHRRPPILSSLYDSWRMTRSAVQLHRKHHFDLVHCRSYMAAIAGLKLRQKRGVPLLFDMRGFWPEEKTEGGAWNLANPLFRAVYRYFKRLESSLLRESAHIVILAEAGKCQLLSRPECAERPERISVIPCCVDFDHFPLASQFRDEARARLGIASDARVIAYLGSIGTWYMLDEMLDFFAVYEAKNPGALFLFITMDDPAGIRKAAKLHGLDPSRIIVTPASREEVPRLLAAADSGISFIKPVFSKTASSPTKLGEMLAAGIPVFANAGVGDVEQTIDRTAGGAIVAGFDAHSYAAAIDAVESSPATPVEISRAARDILDVDRAIDTYDSIYCDMAELGTRSGPR